MIAAMQEEDFGFDVRAANPTHGVPLMVVVHHRAFFDDLLENARIR